MRCRGAETQAMERLRSESMSDAMLLAAASHRLGRSVVLNVSDSNGERRWQGG